MAQDELFAIGKITGAHGIKGAIKIYSYAESVSVYESGSEVILKKPDGVEKRHEIRFCRPYKKGVVLGISGVVNRNQAESLVGCEIYVENLRLPALEEDTYYWSDLIGLSVFSTADKYLGKLKTILPTGSNDVYVISDDTTGLETLIPALATVVKVVDLDNRTMQVELPEGL
jgi:16S rRNA processing protein RimM